MVTTKWSTRANSAHLWIVKLALPVFTERGTTFLLHVALPCKNRGPVLEHREHTVHPLVLLLCCYCRLLTYYRGLSLTVHHYITVHHITLHCICQMHFIQSDLQSYSLSLNVSWKAKMATSCYMLHAALHCSWQTLFNWTTYNYNPLQRNSLRRSPFQVNLSWVWSELLAALRTSTLQTYFCFG